MANVKDFRKDKQRIGRLSAFITAHEFNFADPRGDANSYAEFIMERSPGSQILLIPEEVGLASKTRGTLRLFGKDVRYTTEAVINAKHEFGFNPISFIDHINKTYGDSYYHHSEEYKALLSSTLGTLIVGLSHIDTAATATLNTLNPWAPVSIYVIPKTWTPTIVQSLIRTQHTHPYVNTAAEYDADTIYGPGHYQWPAIIADRSVVHIGEATNRSKTLCQIGEVFGSLHSQIHDPNRALTYATVSTWLDQITNHIDHVVPRYEFGVPTEARLAEIEANNISDRYVFFAKPDEIREYRKTDNGSTSKDDFSSTRTVKLGMYVLKPEKGDSLGHFWFYQNKTLDAWTVKDMVSDYIRTVSPVFEMFAAVNYLNSARDEYTIKLDTNEVSTSLRLIPFWINRFSGIFANAELRNLLDTEAKIAIGEVTKIAQVMIQNPNVDSKTVQELLQSIFETELTKRFAKFHKAYMDALGGAVDVDMISKTAFSFYYDHLSKPQQVKLREYINQGEVNEDVLNHQPMTVWLLLATNSSLNRIRTKKSKLFDSMKFVVPPPRWVLNKLLEAPEVLTASTLDQKRQLFGAIKRTWGSHQTWAWILHEEPKIFSDLSEDVLRRFLSYSNAIESYEYDATVNHHISTYYARLVPPPRGIGGVPTNYNFNKIYTLYNEWLNDVPDDDSGIAIRQRKEYEWKQFALEFRTFIDRVFSEYMERGYSVHVPNSKNWSAVSDSRTLGTEQSQFNDLFVSMAYLYGALTGASPMDSWVNFTSFIWQVNRWFSDAEAWHDRQREQRLNARDWDFRLKEDTEAFIADLIKQVGNWYEWRASNAYYNRGATHVLLDDGLEHFPNEATGLNPTAYKAVKDLFPLLINRCLPIPRQNVVNVKDQKTNLYEEIPGVSYVEKDGLTFKQILCEYDLREEGRNMSHCVGGFNNACERGASVIFHVSPTKPTDPGGRAWPRNMTSTLEWNPKGTKREVSGRVIELANGRATEYVQGQHYSYHNQRVDDTNANAAAWLLRAWNRTMGSEEFHFFMTMLSIFDRLAQSCGFNNFREQLYPPKKVSKVEGETEAPEETVISKYYNKLQVALGNKAAPVRQNDQLQVTLI